MTEQINVHELAAMAGAGRAQVALFDAGLWDQSRDPDLGQEYVVTTNYVVSEQFTQYDVVEAEGEKSAKELLHEGILVSESHWDAVCIDNILSDYWFFKDGRLEGNVVYVVSQNRVDRRRITAERKDQACKLAARAIRSENDEYYNVVTLKPRAYQAHPYGLDWPRCP